MSLLAAERVAVDLGGRRVLHDVDMAVGPGEIVTIVGPNGSGKTTLVRVLVGAVRPDAGRVRRQPALRIGYVPQRLDLDATMPITAGRFLSLPQRRERAAVEAALARTGALGVHDQPLASLSGGQFQRVLLARALMAAPDLLLLDEPTQGLDQPATAAFYALLADLRRELGCAVLMVSHDLHVVMQASDRVLCLNGHICCEGTPTVVSAAPEYRALFGAGTRGAFALYQHHHDHDHDPSGHAHHDPSGHAHHHHSAAGRAGQSGDAQAGPAAGQPRGGTGSGQAGRAHDARSGSAHPGTARAAGGAGDTPPEHGHHHEILQGNPEASAGAVPGHAHRGDAGARDGSVGVPGQTASAHGRHHAVDPGHEEASRGGGFPLHERRGEAEARDKRVDGASGGGQGRTGTGG